MVSSSHEKNLVEGFKRDRLVPKLEIYRPPTASRCCFRRTPASPRSRAMARCHRRPCRWSISTTSRRWSICLSSALSQMTRL